MASTVTITETAPVAATTTIEAKCTPSTTASPSTTFLHNSPSSSPLPIRYVTPKKFDARNDGMDGLAGAMSHLQSEGYAVVSNVAAAHEIKFLLELFWQYVTDISPEIKRDKPETWTDASWPGNALPFASH
jgi:hypothetical protein